MAEDQRLSRRHSQEVAILLATAVIPRSFQRSLLPRNTIDQGIVTSITVVTVYLLGLLAQDTIDLASSMVAKPEIAKDSGNSINHTAPIIASVAAFGIGLITQRYFTYSKDEKLSRSALRTAGFWINKTGLAGLIIGGVQIVNQVVSDDKKAAKERDLLPFFMGAGLAYTMANEYIRARQQDGFKLKDSLISAQPLRVLGISAGVVGLLSGLVYSERFVAKKVDKALGKASPQIKNGWLPVGHLVGAGLVAAGVYAFFHRTYGKIEHHAGEFESGFSESPDSPLQSGSPQSLIPWNTLSIQGRRHVLTMLRADQIEATMEQTAKDPIRIFVGIDSAESEQGRVELAMEELERTGAFTRKILLVVSPTGTGYVNYVMSEAAEYLSLGDIASVTIQYSKRPSPMSLDQVDRGRFQYRMLLNSINKRIQTMPVKARPRVILFGESLGAWTSQDAIIHEGTDGLKALNIDRALWIGTPKGSKWKEQVVANKWLNTDPGLIASFDSFNEVDMLDASAREKLRYVMVTHHNDPIAQFGLELLIKQPEWIADATKRPVGMSSNIEYRTPTLFVQTLVDMKNALKPIPGEFVASAHDYRGDLANFVSFAYGLPASTEQLRSIESALRLNEVAREAAIKGET